MIEKPESEAVVQSDSKSPMPFVELAKTMAELYPGKLMEQLTETFSAYHLTGFDIDAFLEANRKNVDALGIANKRMLENTEAVMVRQGELLRQTMEEAAATLKNLSGADTPQNIAAQQRELIRQMFLRTIENMREVAEMTARSSAEAFETVNQRVGDHMDDIKAMLKRMEKHS